MKANTIHSSQVAAMARWCNNRAMQKKARATQLFVCRANGNRADATGRGRGEPSGVYFDSFLHKCHESDINKRLGSNRKKKKKGLQMARSTSKDAQALFHSLRSAYAATPITLKIIDLYVGFAICTALIQVP
ncbi:hypothetical protein Pint_03510 [Pistacia integerrima]|uniref:Uncharacterized protein n=1 Tax=Pistacia integerrima TaxID=434235 RepID=A0ACC0ZFK5_9ROSI|nr:hypothetical protein Pint_03510 [Pistacia integerrima]